MCSKLRELSQHKGDPVIKKNLQSQVIIVQQHNALSIAFDVTKNEFEQVLLKYTFESLILWNGVVPICNSLVTKKDTKLILEVLSLLEM